MSASVKPIEKEKRSRKDSGTHDDRREMKREVSRSATPEIAFEELEFMDQIGEGCYGEVWRGTCRGQEVAIKKLHKQALDAKTLNDFRKEVEIMSNNHHPNVVLFMGACTQPTKMVMVSELMTQGSVDDLVHAANANDAVSLRQRIKILQDAAHGLNWLHCSDPQIVHRDLKPSNLLIDENGNVKVCDFGLSRIKAKTDPKFKDVDSIPGTPLWMAPEVMLSQELDEKTDIYSFGIVAWEVLTGGNPFEQYDDYDQFKQAICVEGVRPPIPDTMHPMLAQLLKDCWAPSSKQRPSCAQLLRRLNQAAVDCMVLDPTACRFWHQKFGSENLDKDFSSVDWDQFSQAFALLLGFADVDVQSNLSFKCIKALSTTKPSLDLATGASATGGGGRSNAVMTAENFGLLLLWFGPLDVKAPSLFLDRIINVMRNEWFHGDIDSATANARLATAHNSSLLVRCSRKTAVNEPFTISRKTKNSVICHQRIGVSADRMTFNAIIRAQSEDKPDKVVEGNPDASLEEFIKLIRPKLHCERNCKGSDFQSLFVAAQVVSGYL